MGSIVIWKDGGNNFGRKFKFIHAFICNSKTTITLVMMGQLFLLLALVATRFHIKPCVFEKDGMTWTDISCGLHSKGNWGVLHSKSGLIQQESNSSFVKLNSHAFAAIAKFFKRFLIHGHVGNIPMLLVRLTWQKKTTKITINSLWELPNFFSYLELLGQTINLLKCFP